MVNIVIATDSVKVFKQIAPEISKYSIVMYVTNINRRISQVTQFIEPHSFLCYKKAYLMIVCI